MIPKPPACVACPLFERGTGFAPPYGNPESSLVAIAEALGKNEAFQGKPLVGEAGVYWQRALGRLGIEKESLFIGNTVNCQPPGNWLVGAPWELSAIRHCSVHREKLYRGRGNTFLTMGVTATRTVLKEVLNVDYLGEIENWHGYVIGKRPDGPFVIPTYHPSFLLQGNHNLFGAFLHDIKRSMEVASFGPGPASDVQTVVDPPPSYFGDYVNQIPDDPDAWLAVDLETASTSPSAAITRINFSMHPNQGITVPWEERYKHSILRALRTKSTKIFWNERFDLPKLDSRGVVPQGESIDGMWAWHMLQSDLPKGLGFVAPFYSDVEPWKHLSQDDPGKYAALDAIQTLRCVLGIKKDLTTSGQWEGFMKYATQLDHQALYPMERIGIGVSKDILQMMSRSIETSITAIGELIEKTVPDAALPWDGGWKRQPSDPLAFKALVKERVLVCRNCNAKDVGPAHRCKP